mmetsp:Transcript_3301/g.9241  ORF Transcript_3301/g.9241 Transcript_3301/m.9241 type:complete len:877 (+) Transcript_3301:291-2921(+)
MAASTLRWISVFLQLVQLNGLLSLAKTAGLSTLSSTASSRIFNEASFPFLSVPDEDGAVHRTSNVISEPGISHKRIVSATVPQAPSKATATTLLYDTILPAPISDTGKQLDKNGEDNNKDHDSDILSNVNSDRPSYRELEKQASILIDNTPTGSWNQTTVEVACAICQSLSRMSFRGSIVTMEKLIRRMVEEQSAQNEVVGPLQMAPLHEHLIGAWARCSEMAGPDRAEEILEYMLDSYPQHRHNSNNATMWDGLPTDEPIPSRESFNVVLWSHARSSQPQANAKAIRLLSKWYEWYNAGRCSVTPNATSYAAVLFALAKHDPSLQQQGRPDASKTSGQSQFDAPKMVLDLLEQMEKLSQKYPAVKPDLSCYHKYFVAVQESVKRGQITDFEGAILCERHLERMLRYPDEEIHPDSWAFNAAIRSWTHCNSVESVGRCENLLKLQEEYHALKGFSSKTKPLIHSYNLLIDCYARSRLRDKVERATGLLRKLEERGTRGVLTSNMSIKRGFERHTNESGIYEWLRPNSYTYNSVLNTIAKSGKRQAPELAEKILLEMDRKQKEGDPAIELTIRSINVCLNAWAQSGRESAPKRIKDWIDRMVSMAEKGNLGFAPNRVTFNTYLQAMAKTNDPDSCNKAEAVIEEMYKLHEKRYRDVEPDIITFTNILHCFSTSGSDGALEKSMALLDHLEELHAEGQGSMRPSRLTYNCAVNAAAKSKLKGKAKIAEKILRRMESVALKAGTVTYNSVLNACAFSLHPEDDREEVLQIASRMWEEVRQNNRPNYITYQTMLRVVSTQVKGDSEKWRLVSEIVDMCARDGQLTNQVMHGARMNVSPCDFQKLRDRVVDQRTGSYRQEFVANVQRMKAAPTGRFAYDYR